MARPKYSMMDSELMAKMAHEHDLNVSEYAGISALRGKQFGREIYTALVPFRDLNDFLKVFPDVQRKALNSKIRSIEKYVLSGLSDSFNLRFFSSITATAKGGMFYDEIQKRVAINTRESRLSINDGQHRFLGISEALRRLKGDQNRENTEEGKRAIQLKINELEEMVIPLVIFNQIGEREEKQLFHDLNNLATRPNRSATIKLAQTDKVAVMSRELAEENRYLKHMGVEMDKGMIRGDNENGILLTSLYESIKNILKDVTARKREIDPEQYPKYKEYVNDTIDRIFQYLPADVATPDKYIIGKASTLRGITEFIYKGRKIYGLDEDTIFTAISRVDWTPNPDYWKKYGGTLSASGTSLVFGIGGQSQSAIVTALMDQIPESIRPQF